MRIRNLTYELKRPIPLALAGVAAIAVLIAVVIGWQQAEERHDLRRQARLLMMTEASARNELEQMRQAAGTLAALTARMTAQQQELSRLESARAQAQAQLVHVQQDLLAQQTARSELAKMMAADERRAAELRSQHEHVSSGLNTLREESAGLERRVAESRRELEDTQGQLAQVQQEVLAQLTARSEMSKTMEADARRAGELRAQQEQVTTDLNTLREESARLERRVADLEREREDTQRQLAQVQQDLKAQQSARSEMSKTMEADVRRAGELRAQQEEVSSGLNTLREESAGLEGRVTGLKREFEETQRQLDDARAEDARAQQQRERAVSDAARVGNQVVAAAAEQRGSADAVGAMAPTSLRASKLIGVPVIGLDHVSVGEIDDVLTGRDQAAVVVVRTGGFLGHGGKLVALPFAEILWNTDDVSRAPTPSASGGVGGSNSTNSDPAERMPGARISTEALRVIRAMVRLTKAELEQAPAFQYTVRGSE